MDDKNINEPWNHDFACEPQPSRLRLPFPVSVFTIALVHGYSWEDKDLTQQDWLHTPLRREPLPRALSQHGGRGSQALFDWQPWNGINSVAVDSTCARASECRVQVFLDMNKWRCSSDSATHRVPPSWHLGDTGGRNESRAKLLFKSSRKEMQPASGNKHRISSLRVKVSIISIYLTSMFDLEVLKAAEPCGGSHSTGIWITKNKTASWSGTFLGEQSF